MGAVFSVIFIIVAFVVGKYFSNNSRAQRAGVRKKHYYEYNTARFVVGDLVCIKGESHEWAVISKLDDKKVLLHYNEDGFDYEPVLIVDEKVLELA